MQLSYWEYKSWLSNVDFAIIGSGIVGLSTALFLKEKFPAAKILILEKGILPQGASTKNAGFACYGSLSEIISDLESHSEADVVELVQKRWNGIQLLRKLLGDKNMDLQFNGGHELFLSSQAELFDRCVFRMNEINTLLTPIFGQNPFQKTPNQFDFSQIESEYITHIFEGQLDTGKMMNCLLQNVRSSGVLILNSVSVKEFSENGANVRIQTDQFDFSAKKLCITTNGFAKELLHENVRPARAQVLITQPMENLKIKGTFHFDEGYYYFRNIDDRILFGGGRNLDFKAEETTEFAETKLIQNQLEKLLKEVILPNHDVKIDQRWSGIMGVGKQKRPIVKQLSENVFCGVRLGGMGIAIGSLVGKELTDLL